jgi:hypothetical protein
MRQARKLRDSRVNVNLLFKVVNSSRCGGDKLFTSL